MTLTESPDHHGSHRALLPELRDSSAGTVDAIMVPTIRHPLHLETARALAARLNCALVTLHSGKWTSAAAANDIPVRGIYHIAIDIPDPSALRLIDFKTAQLMTGRFARRKDTSAKRNLGLMLARMVGWSRIVFLDDDIDVPDPDDLRRAAGLLDTYNAVGLHIGGYPDNSVVCHAYREIGGYQQSFIGGGALAVETARNLSFFPDIYNEDWFYLLDRGKGLQPLAVTGKVVQQPYDPFRNDDRARMEEVGDVLAEGIFWLLDQGRSLDDADAKHWAEFIFMRRRFIEYILSSTDQASVTIAQRARIESSLKASLGRLKLITPEWCERYVKAWMADRVAWERHIKNLSYAPSVEDALRMLSKKGRPRLNSVIHGTAPISVGVRGAEKLTIEFSRAQVPGIPRIGLTVPAQL